jgi:MtrB/PioB family decaheme-associated outer membrane protein
MAGLLGIAGVATVNSDASDAPEEWRCDRCAVPEGWELDLTFAPAYVMDDAYRFGDFTGLDEQGGYLFGEFFGRYRDGDANYFSFDGYTLSPDATAVFLKGGKQGVYRLRGSYQSIPRRFYDETVTPFLGNGSDTLTLPSDWVRGSNTAGMTALGDTAQPVGIRRDWDVLRLGFDILPESRWIFSGDYGHTERKGNNLGSGSFLFSATEMTSPVNYTTDDMELGARYQGDSWQAGFNYYGSFFENGNEELRWDNPYAGPAGVDGGAMALAPDNESHQFAFSGSVVLPKRTVVSGQIAFGHLSQDQDLLPYTISPGIDTSPLPLASADASADTTNVNLRVVSSPGRKTTLEGEFRFNDFDNRTPVNVYDYVVTDSAPAEIPVANIAYDYERTELKLRGEYRTTSRMKFQLGFDTRTFRRNFQERSRTRTNRLWFRFKNRIGRKADLAVDVFGESRDGSSYDVLENPAAQQNPLMRKYNLSDRDRYGIRLTGSLYPTERWDFGFDLEYGEDDYEEAAIGLSKTEYTRAGLDASWLVTDQGSLFAAVFTERVEVGQAGSQTFSGPDWTATTRDDFDTVSIGFHHPELFGPVGFRVDYNWSRGVGKQSNNTSGLPNRFPDLRSERETVGLGLDYPLNDAWRIGLDYLHEQVSSADWALDGLEPATVPNLLALGADPFNYDVNVVYFSVRYQKPR